MNILHKHTFRRKKPSPLFRFETSKVWMSNRAQFESVLWKAIQIRHLQTVISPDSNGRTGSHFDCSTDSSPAANCVVIIGFCSVRQPDAPQPIRPVPESPAIHLVLHSRRHCAGQTISTAVLNYPTDRLERPDCRTSFRMLSCWDYGIAKQMLIKKWRDLRSWPVDL